MPKEVKEKRYARYNHATQTETYMVDNEEKDEQGNPVMYDLWDAIISIKNDISEMKKQL
jgi:hypothetical protein